MTRRPMIMVIVSLLVALTALAFVGRGVLQRDREALYERYADERRQGVGAVATGISDDIAKIGGDLELASTLLREAESTQLVERQLHAIATIKHEYLLMETRTDDGGGARVVAMDAPDQAIAARLIAPLTRTLDAATLQPGQLQGAGPPPPEDRSGAWHRVFAQRPQGDGPAVAVVVDTMVVLSRLKLLRDPTTKLLVANASGLVAPISNARLAALSYERADLLQPMLGQARDGHAAAVTLDGGTATSIGLPDTAAIAVAVPLRIGDEAPWTLLVVTSTGALTEQEATLTRRVLVGGMLMLVLLLSAAGYVIHSVRRAATLRERLRHAERLAQTEKLVTAGQLAAGIAHEIGTPLNVARGRVELVLSHLGKDHAEAANHQIVIDQIDRVIRLIQQLLDYVRPVPAALERVDLAAMMHVVTELLAAQAAKRAVALRAEAAPGLPRLHGDPDQVQQILVNLVLNAIDACEGGGHVELRASHRGDAIVLEVADDGRGIPAEIKAQIFDPFFTTKKRGQGTGLGLWVVAQLVRAHAAEIELDTTPGGGTIVRVTWRAST